jgi:hypothetical protein
MNEFQAWMKKNYGHLRSYAPDEIANVALACGFPLEDICPSVCDHVSHLRRLILLWESPLLGQWLDLCHYEKGTD